MNGFNRKVSFYNSFLTYAIIQQSMQARDRPYRRHTANVLNRGLASLLPVIDALSVLSCLVLLVYWLTLLVQSDGQGWMPMFIGLFVYQNLSKMLWFRNINNWNW